MIKDNEERTRAYIRALTDIIEEHQAKIQSLGGTYIGLYRMDDDDSYDIYCPKCDTYMYDERMLVDIPNIGSSCQKCRMSQKEKDDVIDGKIKQIDSRLKRLQSDRDDLLAEKES